MTVYILNNMAIHDRGQYQAYLRAFMPVFQKYEGSILAVQDAPRPLEGEWPYDRTVLLSFPSREAFDRWRQSAEYQEIAQHRLAGTVSKVVVLDGFEMKR